MKNLFTFLAWFYYKFYGNRANEEDKHSSAVSKLMAFKLIGSGILSAPIHQFIIGQGDWYIKSFALGNLCLIPIVMVLDMVFPKLFKRKPWELLVALIVPLALISWLFGGLGEKGLDNGEGDK